MITPYALRPDHRRLTRSRGPIEPAGYPTPITITLINGDGSERLITASVWSLAPPINGHRSVWAITDQPITPDHDHRSPISVVITGRRHQVGRSRRDRWIGDGGRYVDHGEIYTQTDHRSPTGHRTQRSRQPIAWPRAITAVPLPQYIYDHLSQPVS